MSDMIRRADAIQRLERLKVTYPHADISMPIDLAIETLQNLTEPNKSFEADLISRTEAIEAVAKICETAEVSCIDCPFFYDGCLASRELSAFPSAEAKRVPQGYCKGADCKWWNQQINGCNRCVMIQDEYTHTSAEAVHKPDYSYEADMVRRLKEALSAEATCATCADRAVCIMSAPDGNWKACKDYRTSAEADPTQAEKCEDCIHNGTNKDKITCKECASAEAVQGEWLSNHDGSWNCSECGLRVLIYAKGNYCPNCGAKMKGGAE